MAKRILAVFLCLCLMIPCIGLQLVSPMKASAAASDYVIKDFGLSISNLSEATATTTDFIPPTSTTLDTPLDISGYSNLGIQLDLYTAGDEGLVSLLESTTGGVSGQIELTSGGTCDVEEFGVDTSVLNFQRNKWVRQVVPLSAFVDTSTPGFDNTALDYVRVYMMSPTAYAGQKATVKICKVRLVNLDVAAPSTDVDPIGDGTFAPAAPVWEGVTFGAEYAPYSDMLVAGYNMKKYAEQHAAELGIYPSDPNFDWAPVFRSLMDGLQAAGGGALFIPAGEYVFRSEVTIPRGVQVYGEWASPEEDRTVKGTVLKVYCGKGGTTPFITMASHSQIQNVSFWYPEQKADAVVAYAPTILTENYTNVENVTFVNAYFAIQQKNAANAPNVSNVYGSPLSKGLDIDMVVDISRMEEIHFSPDYWIHSGLKGAPATDAAAAAFRDYIYRNAIGVTLRRVDWSYLTYSTFHGYKIGVELTKTQDTNDPDFWPNGQFLGLEFYGCLMAIAGDGVQASTISMADIKIGDCDYGIYMYRTTLTNYSVYGSLRATHMEIAAKSYALWLNNNVHVSILDSVITSGQVVASSGNLLIGETVFPNKTPQVVLQSGAQNAILLGNKTASGGSITVTDNAGISETKSDTALNLKEYTALTAAEAAPQKKGPAKNDYFIANVDNTGATDVTEAIQALLTEAGQNGGGMVYLKPGKYLVNGSLTVPTGVELRGATDYASMPAPVNTIILVTKAGSATAAATVNLSASSGIRGITFHYPEQMKNNGSNAYTYTDYPYMVRSHGSNVYVINVSSHNGSYGVDLATNRSDNHYVDALSGHFFRNAIVVGNGSTNGVIRNYQLNYNAILNANNHPWASWGVAPLTEDEKLNYFHLAMQQQIGQNMVALKVGDVVNQLVYDSFNYGCKYGVQLTTDANLGMGLSGTAGANGIRLFGHAVDWSREAIRVEAGSNIQMLNIQVTAFDQKGFDQNITAGNGALASGEVYNLRMTSSFGGEVTIHNFVEWGPNPAAAVRIDGNGSLTVYNGAFNNNKGTILELANQNKVTIVGMTSHITVSATFTSYGLTLTDTRNEANNVSINGLYTVKSLRYRGSYTTSNYTASNQKTWSTTKPTDFVTTSNYSVTDNGTTVTLSASGNAAQTIPAYFNGKPVTNAPNNMVCAHGTTALKNYKAATIDKAGYTGDTVCSACGTVTAYGHYVPATGYAYFDTMGGTLSTSHAVNATGGGNNNVVAIGSTGEYGIQLTGDWQGIQFTGDLLRNVPEGKSATMVIEYYINGTVPDGAQMFRYQAMDGWTGGKYDGNAWNNVFEHEHKLRSNQSGLVFYTFTAEEIAQLRDRAFNFTILGCANNITYIQSARVVDTVYVYDGVDRGYDYGYFEEGVLCEYYPDITGYCGYNVEYTDADFRYIDVYGDALAKDQNKCQPVLIKFYAKGGYENSTLVVNAYEMLKDGERTFSIDLTGKEETVTLKNGVGELFLPMACFTNGLNSAGSFRLAYSECEKLDHFEVYDVATYCAEPMAEAAMVARMHELMLESNYNVTVTGTVDPSLGTEGFSGDTVCATCGALLKEGEATAAAAYAWMETDGGELTTNYSVLTQGAGNINVVSIGSTGKYGIKLPSDWAGFRLSGKLFENVPEGQSVTMAIEYYVDGDAKGQLFRYRTNDSATHVDLYTNDQSGTAGKYVLVNNKSYLVFHTFTAEEVAALRNQSFNFAVMGCVAGANVTYIQSMRLVDTEYVHDGVDKGCTYYSFEEELLCDYYPEILGAPAYNLTAKIHEQSATFNGYYYFWVTGGETLIADRNKNKPILMKFYATDKGYSGSLTLTANFDQSNGSGGYNWAGFPVLNFEDGVATVMVEAGLANRLNGVGSMRIAVDDISKVARVEMYDLATACTKPLADAATKDAVHAWMLENNYNVTAGGAVEPTYDAPGYTAGVVCSLCGETLVQGEEIDRVPYAWIETDGGTLSTSHAVAVDGGNKDVVAIGSTGKYGIKLTGDWAGFNLNGNLFNKVPAGQSVTMAIEYYVDGDAKGQLFRYQPYGGKDWTDLFTTDQTVPYQATLVNNKSHLVFYTFTAAEIAALRDTNFAFTVKGCGPGANVVYIQSLKLVKTEDVHGDTDYGYSFYDFEEKVLCDFYPDIVGTSSYQLMPTIRENNASFTGFHYYWLTGGEAKIADTNANKPIVLKFYAAEGYENATIGNIKYDQSNGSGSYNWADLNVTMQNGVGTAIVSAGMANRLNGLASVRVPVDEQVKYTRIEIYDLATYCAEELATAEMEAFMHDYMQSNSYNLTETAGKDATCTEDGYTAGTSCATCNEFFTGGEVITAPGHTVVIDAAVAATCTTDGKTEGKHCSVCGTVIVAQEVIPAKGHTEVIDAAVEATCTETGLTEGKHCSVCGTVIVAQEVIPAKGHTEVIDAAVEATCTKDGLTEGKHCSTCGEVLVAQEVTAKLGHKAVTDAAVDPTCTEDGLTEGKHCSRCGMVIKAQTVIPATGHENTTTTTVDATCTTDGSVTVTCDKCGVVVSTTVIPKTGHTEVIDAAVEATCTATGLTEGKHCSVCGEVLVAQQIVPMKAHTEVIDAAVEATCTETGLTEGKHCSVCGTVTVEQQIVSPKGHTEVIDAAVEATCTESGLTEGKHCSVCGTVTVEQKVVPANGHTYTDENDNVCDVCGSDVALQYYVYVIENGKATITDVNTAIKGDVIVPNEFEGAPVVAIAADAFADCANITKITLPVTIQSVGANAFNNCTGLTAVNVTDLSAWCGITFGSYNANPLYYAGALYVNDVLVTDLVIPNDVTAIGYATFYGCNSLVSVTIPSNVKTIGRGAFYGSSVETVTIADGVETIGFGAFYECEALSNITIGNTVKTIGNYAFYGCDALAEIALPNSLTTVGDYAFRNSAIESIVIPDSVTALGKGVFYDCASLTEATLPNGITAIGDKLFYNCAALESIVIPDSVQVIGDSAFRGCAALADVTIGAGVTTISANAFREAGLTTLTIPAGVTAVGNNAFRGCAALTTVYFNAENATMGVAAYPVFADCTALTTVYVGDTVAAVPAQAFRGATALTTVYLTHNTTVIEKNAFYLCDAIADVYYIGTASDALALDVKSFNTALTDANWNYNTPCVGEHTWSADCDAQCDLCGATRATTHADIVNDAAVEPTCTTTGLTAGSHCAACGNVITAQKVLTALGHVWNEGEVITAPTAETNGEKIYTCTVCGDTKTVETTLAEIIDGYYYYDGSIVSEAGLVCVEGDYYYVVTGGKVKTGRYAISKTNELPVDTGIYYFFEDGKMNLAEGVYDGYYYNATGKTEAYVGLIEWNGAKYYVNDYGKVIVGRYFVSKLNGLVPAKRAYTFHEDGRMLEDTRIHTDGFYYENGIRIPYAGLVEYEGAFYYVSDNGAYVTGTRQIVANVNNTDKVKNGRYYFDENGKMLFDVVVDGYYYGADGAAPSYAGLVEVDGNYYYVKGTHGQLAVNETYKVTTTNGLMEAGTYTFDATGKLVG